MIIFIDTNVIFNNWHLQNANFQYLFNYLENTQSTLVVSEIVCAEIDNKFNTELNALKAAFQNSIKKAQNVLNTEITFDLVQLNYSYSFKNILETRTDRVRFYSYDNISNKILTDRAIKRYKPFRDEDKGYRDSLIWLSFLDYLKSSGKSEDVAFINNNSHDFYNAPKNFFCDELEKDITDAQLNNSFQVFESIKDFIDKRVTFKHKYTASTILDEFIYPNEQIIEEVLQNYINSQTPQWFNSLLKSSSSVFKDLNYLINYKFEIVEGIEDPELLNWEQIEEQKFYGELSFILRLVDLELKIPTAVYVSNKYSLDDNAIVDIEGDYSTIQSIRKIYLNISFNFDTDIVSIDDIDINMFGVLR